MQNRNLRITYVDISELKEWERNPRKNDQAAERLASLIAQYGFVNPIIATPDGVVRAGHTRLKAARKLGLTKVPVIFVDFPSEEEAQAFSIADNKSTEWATWDSVALEEVLRDLEASGIDLRATGFTEEEIDRILGPDDPTLIDEVLQAAEAVAIPEVDGGGIVCPRCGFRILGGGQDGARTY